MQTAIFPGGLISLMLAELTVLAQRSIPIQSIIIRRLVAVATSARQERAIAQQ